MQEIINKYKKYVQQFDQADERIPYKFAHSLRVMEKMKKLSTKLYQNEEDTKLSIIIGLFHDYGRFYQVENFKTYQDTIFDHGTYGAEELITKHHLQDFIEEPLDEQVIYDAIKNHNKYEIEDGLSEKSICFSKMIRDADKIDILEGLAKGYIDVVEDSEEINEQVKEEFFKQQSIHISNVYSKNDKIICFLGYLYDLNFLWSFEYLNEHQILEQIFKKLKYPERFKEYFSTALNYIEKNIERR